MDPMVCWRPLFL